MAQININGKEVEEIAKKNSVDPKLVIKGYYALDILKYMYSLNFRPLLKGGTAVQLLVNQQFQRLSIDLDLITELGKEQVDEFFKSINFQTGNYTIENEKELEKGQIKVTKYIVKIGDSQGTTIRLDFQFTKIILPEQLTPLKSFFYDSETKIRTLTINALIGDKLTTIGKRIGKPLERNTEYFKQIYDLNLLLQQASNANEIFETYKTVVNYQARSLNLKNFGIPEALSDLIEVLKITVLPEGIGANKNEETQSKELRKGIDNLASYLKKDNKMNWSQARIICAKIALLAKTLELLDQKKITKVQANKILPLDQFEEKLTDEEFIQEIQTQLEKTSKKERIHLHMQEAITASPKSLIYWYYYYNPGKIFGK